MEALQTNKNHETVASNRPELIFLGSSLSFSDHMLRTAIAELSQISVRRFTDCAECRAALSDQKSEIAAIIVEQNAQEYLVEIVREATEFAPNAQIALAYRDEEVPHHILAMVEQANTLRNLSLLPMKLQIENWLAILRLLICGESYLPNSVLRGGNSSAASISVSAPAAQSHPPTNLTPRETEVLALVAKGMQNKTIADALKLSEHTVKLHLHHIIEKLGVRNRTEATVWFLANQSSAPSPHVGI